MSAAAKSGPTLRSLAALAGVTPMTVSLSLRNHPSISAATKARIQQLAAEQGYQPDPVISKLMSHLRSARPQRTQATVCGLHFKPAGPATTFDYNTVILDGVRRGARALGFGFEVMPIDNPNGSQARLERTLLNRGIEGIVLLPMSRTVHLEHLLDWSHFSVVAATSSVLSPHVNTVVPDQFGNMMLLCQRLRDLGLRRLGLTTLEDQDLRVNHRVTAALAWYSAHDGLGHVPQFIRQRGSLNKDALRRWIEKSDLDALICDSEADIDLVSAALPPKVRQRLVFASTSVPRRNARYIGIDENTDEVGAAAIEMLSAMIQRGERGVPACPRTVLIPGLYQETH